MRKRQSDARLYRTIMQSGMIDVDVAFHRAAFHLHRSRSRLSECLALAAFAYADQQAAIGRSGDQIAVQHESDPAKHLHFANGACAQEGCAHARGQFLFNHLHYPFGIQPWRDAITSAV